MILESAKLTHPRFEPHATISYRDSALAIEIPCWLLRSRVIKYGVTCLLDLVIYRKLPSEIILKLGKALKSIAVTCLLCLPLIATFTYASLQFFHTFAYASLLTFHSFHLVAESIPTLSYSLGIDQDRRPVTQARYNKHVKYILYKERSLVFYFLYLN